MGDFFDKPEKKKVESPWLKISEGAPVVVQIMDEHPTEVHTHWITDSSGRKVGFKCLGSAMCPACQRNNRINWDNKHPDYVRRSNRYRLNVLDLTPVVVCPECGAEYHYSMVPDRCSLDSCNADLTDVEPAPRNRVKVLEKGVTVMQQLDALDSDVHPLTDEKMSIQEYPIKIMAQGKGLNTVTMIHPLAPRDDIDFDVYERHDLEEMSFELTPDEIEYLLDGGTLNDILAARSADDEVEVEEDEEEVPF